jgi:hypothetical protein
MHTAELLVSESTSFEVEITVEKLQRYKSPGIDQMLGELIKAGGNTSGSEVFKLIKSVWNKEKLPQQWKESTTAPIHTKDDEADYSNYTNYVQNIYWYSSLKVNFICRQIYWGSSVWILM